MPGDSQAIRGETDARGPARRYKPSAVRGVGYELARACAHYEPSTGDHDRPCGPQKRQSVGEKGPEKPANTSGKGRGHKKGGRAVGSILHAAALGPHADSGPPQQQGEMGR